MTRDEAIDYLLDPIGKREKHDEAIHMAIEALKRDATDTNVEDTIYRQMVIDAMCNACSDRCDEGAYKKVSAIQRLPSTQRMIFAVELRAEKMSELKPCPFCGCKALIIDTGNHFPRKFYRIVCQSCCTMQGKLFDTEEKSIEAWNRRTER